MKINKLIAIGTLAITLGAVTMFQSCTRLGKLLNINLAMQTESVNVTLPVSTDTSGTITIGPTVENFNVDSFIMAQTGGQFNSSNISSVKLRSVVFTLNNAEVTKNNFSAFESVAASFYSNTNSKPYTVTIANNPDVFASTLSVPIDTTVELKSYIGNKFNYTVSGKQRHATTKELDCTITFTFSMDVKA